GPACAVPPNCPPGSIAFPVPPQPGMPRPTDPAAPPGQPGAAAPAIPSFGSDTGGADIGQEVALGVTNFGDQIGGAAFAGPLPVRLAANGRLIGPVPVVVLPNGQRVALGVTAP